MEGGAYQGFLPRPSRVAGSGPLVAATFGPGLEDASLNLVAVNSKRCRPRAEEVEVTAVGAWRPRSWMKGDVDILGEPLGNQPIQNERLRPHRLGPEVQKFGSERRSKPPQPAVPREQLVSGHRAPLGELLGNAGQPLGGVGGVLEDPSGAPRPIAPPPMAQAITTQRPGVLPLVSWPRPDTQHEPSVDQAK
jgi:hypothetical protein